MYSGKRITNRRVHPFILFHTFLTVTMINDDKAVEINKVPGILPTPNNLQF